MCQAEVVLWGGGHGKYGTLRNMSCKRLPPSTGASGTAMAMYHAARNGSDSKGEGPLRRHIVEHAVLPHCPSSTSASGTRPSSASSASSDRGQSQCSCRGDGRSATHASSVSLSCSNI